MGIPYASGACPSCWLKKKCQQPTRPPRDALFGRSRQGGRGVSRFRIEIANVRRIMRTSPRSVRHRIKVRVDCLLLVQSQGSQFSTSRLVNEFALPVVQRRGRLYRCVRSSRQEARSLGSLQELNSQ